MNIFVSKDTSLNIKTIKDSLFAIENRLIYHISCISRENVIIHDQTYFKSEIQPVLHEYASFEYINN